jgi:hypothetical protein
MRGLRQFCGRAVRDILQPVARRAAVALALGVLTSAAHAQSPAPPASKAAPQPEMMQNCPGLVADRRPPLTPAAFRLAALDADQVRITYVGHATFLIESPQLVRIATDYNDYVRPTVLPDIITMNHAHDTHYTDHPDPGRSNTCCAAGAARPTSRRCTICSTATCGCATCRPTSAAGTAAPSVTAITALKPSLIIPMHFFNEFTLARFLDRAHQQWEVQRADVPSLVVSKATLPPQTKVLVLPGH